MAQPAMVWIFIVWHVVALVILWWLLDRMELKSDAETDGGTHQGGAA